MTLRFTYTGIRVSDIDASVRFYTDLLGMEVVEPLQSTSPTQGKVVGLRSPGSSQLLELNWYEPGSQFGSRYAAGEALDHLAFEVDDVPRLTAELEAKGAKVLVRSREIGGSAGWNEAFLEDPDGIWIELIPAKAPPARPS